jgi:hypothetical protein
VTRLDLGHDRIVVRGDRLRIVGLFAVARQR